MLPNHIPLCVPPWDQQEALNAGALYHESLGYYIPKTAYLDDYHAWLPRMYQEWPSAPLMPDMLPVSTWEQNIRHRMSMEVWDRLRRYAYKAAGWRCEICGAQGQLEAHELFFLENETCVQRLEKLLALCPLCHKAHHLGIARRLGMLPEVQRHMMRVNNWTLREMQQAIQDAYEVWEQRNEWEWELDLSWLYKSGYIHVTR